MTYQPNRFSGVPNPAARIRFNAISEAWDLLRDQIENWSNLGLVFLVIAVPLVIMRLYVHLVLPLEVARSKVSLSPTALIVLDIASIIFCLIIGFFIQGGLFRAAIKQTRGHTIGVSDFFRCGDVAKSLLGFALITVFLMAVEVAIFLLVPHRFAYITPILSSIQIIAYHFFYAASMLTIPIIVDQKVGTWEAVRRSWNALKRQLVAAFIFLILCTILSLLGLLFCGIGLIVTLPIQFLAIAIVYRDFFGPSRISKPNVDVQIWMPLPPAAQGDTPSSVDDI